MSSSIFPHSKTAEISLSDTGAIIAAVPGKEIVVTGYFLVATGGTSFKFTDSAGDLSGSVPLAAGAGVAYAGGMDAPAAAATLSSAVTITLSAPDTVTGHVAYVER